MTALREDPFMFAYLLCTNVQFLFSCIFVSSWWWHVIKTETCCTEQ